MTKSNKEWVPEVGQDCEGTSVCGFKFKCRILGVFQGTYPEAKCIAFQYGDGGIEASTEGNSYTFKPIKTEAEKQQWPEMPDKFYEGLGWMHAECCAALDKGEDPRNFEVGDMVNRCIKDLTVDASIKTEAEKRRDDQIEAICRLIPSKPLADSVSYEVKKNIASALVDADWIKPKPLTIDVFRKLMSASDEITVNQINAYIRGEG